MKPASGRNARSTGERTNAGKRRRNGAGTAFGENGNDTETTESGGLYERKTTTDRARAGRLSASHKGGAEKACACAHTEHLLSLRRRQLPFAGRWGRPRLSADDFPFRLLYMVSVGDFAAGRGAGNGDFSFGRREAVRGVRNGFRSPFQPGEILWSLRRKGTSAAKEPKRQKETEQPGQIGACKAPFYRALRTVFGGGRYCFTPTPENPLLTVRRRGPRAATKYKRFYKTN